MRVMAVTFVPHGQLHYLAADADHRVGDLVLYPTSGGTEVATVAWPPTEIDTEAEIPRCAGAASEADVSRDERVAAERADAKATATRLIGQHGLPMKVVAVDILDRQPDVDRLVAIYYQADQRVDFRALVGDLARTLRARVDLRQIGARDATRLTGGIGLCGRPLCCATWLDDFEPISIRLAKTQDLSTNLLAISGVCGRLMCCLRYEQELYLEFQATAPAVGVEVTTPAGPGRVVGHNVPSGTVRVAHADGQTTCPVADACPVRSDRKPRWRRPKPEAPKTEPDS